MAAETCNADAFPARVTVALSLPSSANTRIANTQPTLHTNKIYIILVESKLMSTINPLTPTVAVWNGYSYKSILCQTGLSRHLYF